MCLRPPRSGAFTLLDEVLSELLGRLSASPSASGTRVWPRLLTLPFAHTRHSRPASGEKCPNVRPSPSITCFGAPTSSLDPLPKDRPLQRSAGSSSLPLDFEGHFCSAMRFHRLQEPRHCSWQCFSSWARIRAYWYLLCLTRFAFRIRALRIVCMHLYCSFGTPFEDRGLIFVFLSHLPYSSVIAFQSNLVNFKILSCISSSTSVHIAWSPKRAHPLLSSKPGLQSSLRRQTGITPPPNDETAAVLATPLEPPLYTAWRPRLLVQCLVFFSTVMLCPTCTQWSSIVSMYGWHLQCNLSKSRLTSDSAGDSDTVACVTDQCRRVKHGRLSTLSWSRG